MKSKKNPRKQSLGEEIANAISHGSMALFGVVSLVLLLIKSNVTIEYVAACIFGLCIILLYTMSTLYHALTNRPKKIFRKLDHISIYFLIGGTFAPPLLLLDINSFFGLSIANLGLILFIIQWIIIFVGSILKFIWVEKYIAAHTVMFLMLGWSGLIFLRNLYAFDVAAFWLILSGGIAYSLGVIFFALSAKIKYSHFIWHLFVAAGTILHFIAIYGFLY